jgi:hypothetical protein
MRRFTRRSRRTRLNTLSKTRARKLSFLQNAECYERLREIFTNVRRSKKSFSLSGETEIENSMSLAETGKDGRELKEEIRI